MNIKDYFSKVNQNKKTALAVEGVINMGEIKFRAWDAKEKHMLEVNHLFNLGNKQPIEVWTNDYEGGYRFNPDKSEIMQYTGLKDVNGVEIYEGDIVEGGIEGRRSLIKISSYGWLKQALEDEFNKTYCNYKIIGNKFENPELLEVEE